MTLEFNFEILLCHCVTLSIVNVQISGLSSPDPDHQCEVMVAEPWPEQNAFVPLYSQTVQINCTATSESTFWSVDLGNDSTQLQYRTSDVQLSNRDVYELPRINTSGLIFTVTLRLLINNTSVNNQTVIYCNRGETLDDVSTTIFVFKPPTFTLKSVNTKQVNSINISWIQQQRSSVMPDIDMFSLRIDHGSRSRVMFLNNPYYHFTSPEGAPPCEVYNFSVTATYVGATYTGAGCSVPSPVLSTMLPSLPNISQLESSLVYVLEKQLIGFVVKVSFEPASSCENYPIMNYTLEVNSSLNREIQASISDPDHDDYLSLSLGGSLSDDNTLYTFRILVTNEVGTIPTSDKQFYTTDVQVVKVTLIEGANVSSIQCEFIAGSNATGCMVVLTGFVPYHVNLTRNPSTNLTSSTVTLEHPLSCYTGVEAFDIESDGSVGSLAVPGQLGGRLETPCTPIQTSPIKPKSTEPLSNTLIVVIVVIIIVVVVAVVILLVAVITSLMRKNKRFQVGTTDTYSKFGCPASLCCSQSSADECVCTDTSAKNHPGEVAITAKGESLYSEVVPSNKRKKRASTSSADVKADNAYSEPTGAPTKGYTSLLLAGGQEDTPQEALYDQPIPMKVKTPVGGADNDRNDLSTANCESTHATQDTHLYFTLEEQGRATDRINSTPTSLAPSNISDPPQPASNECPPPVYQEITDLKIRGQATTSTVSEAGSIPNTPLPSSSPPLIQRSLSVPAADSDTQNPVG